ncbi:hypothetical protein CY34DRAFT_619309 [Suillus luteus UH-Slu-Lm8-n1]|uniref:Uncharacterized protein n=1 Tax=Suillus luteus UH-Slu-Lm8-n1 TaxID=930992 RepID=A0A0D0B3J8_9AGAM|nr:hypothetical protein CY34DRAFT_619309 [Suillus luteus UH-Slu-Lm8-n1]
MNYVSLMSMEERIKEDAQTKAIIGRSHFSIRTSLPAFLKKTEGRGYAARYFGVFENGHRRFAEMGVTFTEGECVFMLLNGLLDTPNGQSVVDSPSMPIKLLRCHQPPQLQRRCRNSLSKEEANLQNGKLKLQARSGSEYANAVCQLLPMIERQTRC